MHRISVSKKWSNEREKRVGKYWLKVIWEEENLKSLAVWF